MSRRSFLVSSLVAVALLPGGMSLSPLAAQEPESPKIVTVDGVRLNALFYRSAKKSAGTVIMLHPIGIGESIKKEGWKDLAETLQKSNYSVLMFDFRGHGDSTTIDQPEAFWSLLPNRMVKRSNKEGDAIDVKDYLEKSFGYYPVLVNDIAAVKAYLDRRHDAGECNTSNTIVIGADSGATLGALWINSEWHRFRYIPPENMFMKGTLEKRAEGNDIVAGVFLTIQPKLGTRTVSLPGLFREPCKNKGMPAVFFYGAKGEAKTITPTKELLKSIKGFDEKSKKYAYIGPVPVPDTNLSGVKLLTKGLKTKDTIVEYIDNVLKDRGNEWEARNVAEAQYMWRDPRAGGLPVPARTKMEKTLKYDTYEKFITP